MNKYLIGSKHKYSEQIRSDSLCVKFNKELLSIKTEYDEYVCGAQIEDGVLTILRDDIQSKYIKLLIDDSHKVSDVKEEPKVDTNQIDIKKELEDIKLLISNINKVKEEPKVDVKDELGVLKNDIHQMFSMIHERPTLDEVENFVKEYNEDPDEYGLKEIARKLDDDDDASATGYQNLYWSITNQKWEAKAVDERSDVEPYDEQFLKKRMNDLSDFDYLDSICRELDDE